MCRLFQKFDDYNADPDKEDIDARITELCEQILQLAKQLAHNSDAQIGYMGHPLTARAIEYINDHITKPICVDEIARELNITKRYLYKLFDKHLGTTPQKYIISKKLRLAQDDLRVGRMATEVCASYGFADYPSFYRHYTRYFGHKPSDARKVQNSFDETY